MRGPPAVPSPPGDPGSTIPHSPRRAAIAMPRFAANLTLLFTEVPFLDRFERAARAGFEAVECQLPYAHAAAAIRARLEAWGLRMVLHNLPAGDWMAGERGIACLPGREAEFRAGLEQAIEYARALGVPQLNCLAGLAPPGADRAALHATFAANLRHAARRLRDEGLRLLIEPINGFDMPGFFLDRPSQAFALLDELDEDGLFVQYDLYHAYRTEGRLAEVLAAELPRIAHVQVADHPGRHEPGSGEIGCAALFDELDRLGYAGWVGAEYLPAAGTEAGLGWFPGRRRAR